MSAQNTDYVRRSWVPRWRHDTCPACGKDIQMRNDRKLYHHGHPARRCPGAGKLGLRMARFMAEVAAMSKSEQFDGPEP